MVFISEVKKRAYTAKFIIAVFFVLSLTCNASATTIAYSATNLPNDGTYDLWRYDYFVSGYSFNEFESFTIHFDYHSYGLLSDVTAGSDWDVFGFQPDSGLQHDGMYDSMAIKDNASPVGFSVSFIWLGSGSEPGSQPYEIYDENYDIAEQGMTIVQSPSSVPEPGTMTLACLGLISLVYVKRIQNI